MENNDAQTAVVEEATPSPSPSRPKRARKVPAKGPGLSHDEAYKAATLFRQLGDPSRVRIVTILAEGEKNVGDLCLGLGTSQPAASHHLALLRFGGVVLPRREGKNNFYHLTPLGETLAGLIGQV